MSAATPRIRVLPPELADRIAAGEVVQRPASAVKELLENALDAGARSVEVVVKDAGRTLLQVADDGAGMGWEDARAAFDRHATSKISRSEDLDAIATLGFRGEALASIAAVAHVELATGLPGEETGSLVRIEGGTLRRREQIPARAGTSVTVRNLFYNTPGRRKFLKSDRTEFRQILDVVQRAALSSPGVAFSLTSDGEKILSCAPGTVEERIAAIFGGKSAASLIRCEAEAGGEGDAGGGALLGFLGRPEFARKGRPDTYLFLNGRPIVSRSLAHAVTAAYEHTLEKGSFPLIVLFLTIDPRRADVNVHPAKSEVRFDDENAVYRWVRAAARRAIAANDPGGERPDRPASIPPAAGQGWSLPGGLIDDLFRIGEPGLRAVGGPGGGTPGGEAVDPLPSGSPAFPGASPGTDRPCWQVHDKYLVAPVADGLMIVDQHAAHERVLYERAVRRFEAAEGGTQELLFPQTLEMSPADAGLVRELEPLLRSLGFQVKFFGGGTVILEGVPLEVRPGEESAVLRDVLGMFREEEGRLKLGPRERLATTFACRTAVKAGDRLTAPEIAGLLGDLLRAEVPYVCPHGRPVAIRLTLSELDRRFGRTS